VPDVTFWLPTLSVELQALIRAAYGVLMLATLGAALPHARRYFMSERWGGYAVSGRLVDALLNPVVVPVVLVAWIAAALGLALGSAVLPSAAVNVACCYYFFNRLRWQSVSRGMGAPGFMSLWLGAGVLLLEFTTAHAPAVRALALLTLQLDFAGIMLSAGLYKLAAGYRRNLGMELGMANPEWGYWSSFWSAWHPKHPLFRFLNEMAWGTEVVCGLLMLVPGTRALGGAGILLSFFFIASQIRLGFLCEMVMVCCLLFFGAGSLVDLAAVWLAHTVGLPLAAPGLPAPAVLQAALNSALWVYLGLLPLVRAGMFYNQLRHRPLPAPWQRALDLYANTFGLILWRVFTADVVNFFVRVWEQPATGARRLLSEFRLTGPYRFSQVAECIALTSVFTTLKYYPSNRMLFESRLLRYARTMPRQAASSLVFEWVSVAPRPGRFEYVPVAEFLVGADAKTVVETTLTDEISVRAVAGASPVHEGARPGSYAPLADPRSPIPDP